MSKPITTNRFKKYKPQFGQFSSLVLGDDQPDWPNS